MRASIRPDHFGIVLFRLPRESRLGSIRLADALIQSFDFAAASGALVVVSPGVIRIHRSRKA